MHSSAISSSRINSNKPVQPPGSMSGSATGPVVETVDETSGVDKGESIKRKVTLNKIKERPRGTKTTICRNYLICLKKNTKK